MDSQTAALDVPQDPTEALGSSLNPGTKGDKFRLNSKKLFLTYPKNNTTHEEVALNINAMWGDNLEGYWIGQEPHKDGTLHLHVGVLLKERVNIVGADTLDVLAGKHGNYYAMKNPKKCIAYCTKTDLNPIIWGTAVELKKASGPLTLAFIKELESGKPLDELKKDDLYKPMFFGKRKNILEYVYDLNLSKKMLQRIPWSLLDMKYSFPTSQDKVIATWLNLNLFVTRQIKQLHLWIYAPTNHGKSTLVEWLKTFCSVYSLPLGEDFYDMWDDEKIDLVVIEEYGPKRSKPIQWLNEFAQGTSMNLRKKNGQVMKTKNAPIILLSNYLPEQVYPRIYNEKKWIFDTLMTRWYVIKPKSFINVSVDHHNFTKHLYSDTSHQKMFDDILFQSDFAAPSILVEEISLEE